MRKKVESDLGTVLVWALVSGTLLITPIWALDPVNPIKMLVISATACMGFGVMLVNQKVLGLGRFKVALTLTGAFMAWQIIVFLVSDGEKLQQIFGTAGRNTGLITYLAFSILFVVSIAGSNTAFLPRFFLAALVVGIASLGYGLIQALDLDPFDWVGPYSSVFGFLGNPNFQSSLLGILGSIVFAQLFSVEVKLGVKGAYLAYLLLTLFVIAETQSQQGFLVLLIGSAIAFGIYINQRSRTLGYSYLGLALIGFVAVLLGTLNKGPLASLLFKDSVTYRGDYWRAGWKMSIDNPIFGVGMDSYGDWYRRSRTLDATLRRGPDATTNAAHNVFLDISSYGGFPLLIIYVLLLALVVVSAVKVLKRQSGFNPSFAGLVGGWVAFQAQSLISINQIGLAIWGWVLSGLIIGYEINTRDSEVVLEKKIGKDASKKVQRSAETVIGVFAGLIIGVVAGMPPYLATTKFKSALETGNPTVVKEAAYIWPVEADRMIKVAVALNENKLETEALKVSLDATSRFPDNYLAWAALNIMKSATTEHKAQALAQMKRLDPLNPNLK